jgi:membrane protease YdiL (CAAX protease family)
MPLLGAAVSALAQVLLLGGVPLFGYWIWQRQRYKRTFGETARRAGLKLGRPRYLLYSLLFAACSVAALVISPPPMEPLIRQGSMYRPFAGLGLGGQAISMALLYGVVKTGFTEELLFRGLIAGSLSRRLPIVWANLAQALLFFLPHLGILLIANEPWVWRMLPVVYAVGLVLGWLRIQSGSILGSWLVHACSNVAMALVVASQSQKPPL